MTKRISPFLTHRPRLPRPDRLDPNDPQKHLVYAMERSIAGWAIYAHVELDDLQRIANYVCRRFKIKPVGIAIEHLGKTDTFGWCADYTIHLNADFYGDNTSVLAHELAHYVTDNLEGDVDAHGPEFMGYYAEILDMLNLFPWTQFVALCDEWGVEVSGAC